MKHFPFLFERCVSTLLQCILRDIVAPTKTSTGSNTSIVKSSVAVGNIQHSTAFSCSSSFWNMMRLLRELPHETLTQLSGVLGAGLLAVIK